MNEQFMIKMMEMNETIGRIDERSKVQAETVVKIDEKQDKLNDKIEQVDEKVNSIDARLKIIEERKSLYQHTGTIVKYCWNSKPIKGAVLTFIIFTLPIIASSFGIVIPPATITAIKALFGAL
jgi:hypothetical protein